MHITVVMTVCPRLVYFMKGPGEATSSVATDYVTLLSPNTLAFVE